MVFKWTGSHLGRDGRKGAGLSVLVVAVGCICVAPGAAQAQSCSTPPGGCTANAQCNDGKFCTLDFCFNPGLTGTCMCFYSDYQCEDGLFCNGIGYCDVNTDSCKVNATSCQYPTPYCSEALNECVQCSQNSECTTPPWCDTSSGTCVQCLNDFHCQDVPVPLVCNGVESCNTSTGLCQAGTPPNCPKKCFRGPTPGATCTTDSNCGTGGKCLGFCSELRGGCVQCDHDSGCDDGKFCNGAETCTGLNNTCVAGTPPVCKKCVNGPDNLQPCSTNADCRSPGTCTGGPSYCEETLNRCVQCLSASQCDDFNFCTSNACVYNSCVFPENPAICSDGLFCNGQEICNHVLGNSCSLYNDRAHCCFKGLCSPKTCTSNANCPPDTTCNTLVHVCTDKGCNSNADCPSGTTCNNSTATSCNADHSACTLDCNDDIACTVDSCNETNDSCQSVLNDAACSDGLGCTGTETCKPTDPAANPVTGCKPGTPIVCSSLNPDCSEGVCLEQLTVHCQSQPINQGAACDDDNPCTVLSKCNNGSCVDNPPAPNDPYRCVKLEWRASSPTTVLAGATVELGLYAVANGCNTPNARCIGGAQDGDPCDAPSDCPGGACIDDCPATALAVSSVDALFSWNKTFLQLQPSTGPDPNPQDPCVVSDPCNKCVGGSRDGLPCSTNGDCPGTPTPGTCTATACPADQYAWGSSGWINDCNGDRLNDPCSGGVPANDGNARYLGLQDPVCADGVNTPPSACATTTGLHVTTIKFKAISGGTSQIAFLPCFGAGSKTQVQSPIVVIDVPTSDVTKSLGPAVTITVTCDSHDDCNDNNVCTNDSCNCTTPNCGGTCQHVNNTLTCEDGFFCTTNDHCILGVCQGGAAACSPPLLCDEANDRCVECLTVADCNDGHGCTVDTCVNGSCQHADVNCHENPDVACTTDACVEPNGTCTHTPNNAFCNPTNSFCSSAVCDPVEDCVFDHECISTNGNPCPDPATCNEESRTCGGCKQPTAVGISCRYLAVTPAEQGEQGLTPVALVVTGDCGDPNGACVYQYVQSKCNGGANNGLDCLTDADCPKTCAGGTNQSCSGGANNGLPCTSNNDCPNGTCRGNPCTTDGDCPVGTCAGKCDAGTLGGTPFYKTASQWGTAKVRGAQIRPGADYLVETECNFPGIVVSAAASARTWKWGDTDGNGIINALDIVGLVDAFKQVAGALPFEQVNIWGCTPDGVIDALDIVLDVDAFKGFAFPCGLTCP